MLPAEICTEILKTFPNQKRISHSLNQYNKYFYDQFYNLPISQNEAFNHLLKGNTIVIFREFILNDLPEFYIHTIKYLNYIYRIDTVDIRIHEVDKNEHFIIFYERFYTDQNTYEKLSDIIAFGMNDIVYYDLYTTYQIILNRHCEKLDYCKNYLLNEFNNHINLRVNNLYSFFDFVKTLFYIDINKAIYTNDEMIFNVNDINDVIDRHHHLQCIFFLDNHFHDDHDHGQMESLSDYYIQVKKYMENILKRF